VFTVANPSQQRPELPSPKTQAGTSMHQKAFSVQVHGIVSLLSFRPPSASLRGDSPGWRGVGQRKGRGGEFAGFPPFSAGEDPWSVPGATSDTAPKNTERRRKGQRSGVRFYTALGGQQFIRRYSPGFTGELPRQLRHGHGLGQGHLGGLPHG
jgi:hypothetical protein